VLVLDASYGEGGGQILRTALSLSVVLRRPVTLTRIRARRPRPGLQPQHLAVVRALAAISGAEVEGDTLGSGEVRFSPRALCCGDYRFDVAAVKGSAGSVSLLFQALLLPLAFARGPSRLTLLGGTHVPWSPSVHYLTAVFLPALHAIGPRAEIALRRFGWYPRGGGEVEALVEPRGPYEGVSWVERPARPSIAGVSLASRLPLEIAARQRRRALERLATRGLEADIALIEDATARGPGTFLLLGVSGAGAFGGFSALGRRGVRAEAVADEAVDPLLRYLDGGAAVDAHLADQLVPILALAATPSSFTCLALSGHLLSVAWLVRQLLPARIDLIEGRPARIEITPPATAPRPEPSEPAPPPR
jgi:RNA 3'-terminal phosphate cyclase (ATP)